jgi:hypothetical protein
MTPHKRGSLLRILTVFGCVAGIALVHLGDLARPLGDPIGWFGLITDGKVVRQVLPDSAAQRARLRAGERIDLTRNSFLVREGLILEDFGSHAGSAIEVRVLTPPQRTVVLRALPEASSDYPLIWLRELLAFVPIAIGAILLLLRPSPITWWLFLMMLDARQAPSTVAYYRLFTSPAAWFSLDLFQIIVGAGAKVAQVMFAFSLAGSAIRGWRIVPVVGAAVVAVPQMLAVTLNEWMPGLTQIGTSQALQMLEQVLIFAFVLSALADAFRHTRESARGKMLWLAAGLLVSTVCSTIDAVLWSNYGSYAAHTALRVATLVFPFLSAYALVATRVVDIRFAISRTIIYGGITAALIVTFSVVDLLLTRGLSQGQLSLPFDIIIAVALGFFIHNIHSGLDAFVERVLFRQRFLAAAGLNRAAHAVMHAHDERAVGEYVTEVPVTLLGLTGAGLYRRGEKGYTLDRIAGWKHLPSRCTEDDPLCLYLAAELSPVRPSDLPVHREWPKDAVLAIPFLLRRELGGFVIYGAHRDGTEIDASEERELRELVRSADLAYERSATIAMEEELTRLRALVAAQS